jgi:amidase
MARTVRDAAVLLSALTGVDPRDRATAASAGKAQKDYTQFLDANGLRGARIGVGRKYFGFSETVDRLMNDLIEEMKKQGAVIVDPADLPSFGKFNRSEFLVLQYELKADLNAYLATRPNAPVHSLKEIIDFNDANRQREMPWFGQDIFLKAEEKGPLAGNLEYLDALENDHQMARTEGIDAADGGSGLANRPDQWRPRLGWEFECCRGSWISGYHRAGWIPLWIAGGNFILWARLERTETAQDCVWI